MQNKENKLTLLRFFAILLIINSHLNSFYPTTLVASITLEIYILQDRIVHMVFPINIILFWFAMIPFTWLVHFTYKKLLVFLIGINNKDFYAK